MPQSLNEIVKQEEEVLKFWKEKNIFQKSLDLAKGAKRFVFFEGPPSANGEPGLHHVLARVYKDAFSRFKAMCGYLVERKGGWDTHGLPIEVQLEKELGLKNKKEVEKYGLAKFNEQAKESVWRYKQNWEQLTDRIGFWLDQKNAYITYDWKYMESLWWIIKKIHERGLLYQDYKVVPYCYRCGTALSQHEVAQGYREVTENSVYLKFRIKNQESRITESDLPTYILSWTTTPWTLPGNVALAVGIDIDYSVVRVDGLAELLIVASSLVDKIFKNRAVEQIKTLKGKELVELQYESLFDIPALQNEKSHRIYADDFVSTEEGTGVVHTAVMYGEDDYNLGVQVGLPQHHTVDEQGKFTEDVPEGFYGMSVKNPETEKRIIEYLRQKGFLFAVEPYSHEYPFCWRCDNPLLYYAQRSWFIGVSKLRKELLKNNEKINWIPEAIKQGRFGNWLKEIKDWNFSRTRYWGTALPVWKCKECEHRFVVGSLEELEKNRLRRPNNYILLRHAASTANEHGFLDTNVETSKVHLTEQGKLKAQEMANALKDKKIDLIFASDFPRTKQTAQYISEIIGLPVEFDARLRELNVGELNGRPVEEYHALFKEPLERFNIAPQNGETWRQVRSRTVEFIKNLEAKHEGKTILIVSHEAPIWMLETGLAGFSDEESLSWGEVNHLEPGSYHIINAKNYPFNRNGEIDLHRPHIDKIELKCPKCGGLSKRVPELIDVWFDSGAMPFAQWHWPFENKERIEGKSATAFPADFISEGIDQTRGWFWSLLAVSTLLEKGPPYLNVISLAHVLDREGKKMSKSKGNAVAPQEIIDKYGIDALRWYFFTVNGPGDSKLFDEKDITQCLGGFIRLLWNSWIFFSTYARITPALHPPIKTPALDQWLKVYFNRLVGQVKEAMERYDATSASRLIEKFVNDLSNWYIRRSRERFAQPESAEDFISAQQTLGRVLADLSALIGPFVPFLAEALHQNLKSALSLKDCSFAESVHLTPYPVWQKKFVNDELLVQMEIGREIVTVLHGLRNKAGIRVRQPLAEALVRWGELKIELPSEILRLVADELNVKEVKVADKLPKNDPDYLIQESPRFSVGLKVAIDQFLLEEGCARELARTLQEMRKQLGLTVGEQVTLQISASEEARKWIGRFENELKKKTGADSLILSEQIDGNTDIEREFKIGEHGLKVAMQKHE